MASIQHADSPVRNGHADHNFPRPSMDTRPPLDSPFNSFLSREDDTSGFDEAVLRNLCDIDCGLPLLLDRLKQSAASCKEASLFLRKRAQLEEEHARSSSKLSRSSLDSYKDSDGRAGTFVSAYSAFLKTHDFLSENHLRFAGQLNEMSEQLMELSRESERVRKNGKEVGSRLERTLTDSEQAMDKARVRFDAIVEELERCLVTKAGESVRQDPALLSYSQSTNGNGGQAPPPKRTFGKAMSKLKSTRQGTSKNEDELRARVTAASEAYRREVSACQTVRRDHWVNHIPRLLRQLKESVDEIENGTSFHLSRYAYLYEHLCLQDGATMAPPGGIEEGPGLKAVVEAVDNREDFKQYMEMYHVAYLQSPAAAKGPAKRGQGMLDEDGYVNAPAPQRPGSALHSQFSPADYQPKETMSLQHREPAAAGPSNPKAVFGVTLNALMDRDGLEVPRVLEECAAVIEAHGLEVTGIYRLSGTTSKIQRLKARLDTDVDRVDLSSEEYLSDINDITGVLKLWFRELPEPLMTFDIYQGFVEAAKIENDRLRHIRLHERVNELPDSHYATLKFLMGHLHKVQRRQAVNSMSISNLAIVFGPTLFRPPPGQEASQLQDMTWQCKAVETILIHYEAIFVPGEE